MYFTRLATRLVNSWLWSLEDAMSANPARAGSPGWTLLRIQDLADLRLLQLLCGSARFKFMKPPQEPVGRRKLVGDEIFTPIDRQFELASTSSAA